MHQIGNKIRKIRELKGIPPKDMADRLDMTVQGYQRIERDEVSVNIEKLMEIAGIFEMKPEDVMNFDERIVLNNYGEIKGNQIGMNQINFPEEMKKLYEDKIRLLEDKIRYLEEKVAGK